MEIRRFRKLRRERLKKADRTVFSIVRRVVSLLDNDRRRQLYRLMLLGVLVSMIEVFGISLIMPFVQVAVDFKTIHTNRTIAWIYESFGFPNEVTFVITIGLGLMGFYLLRSLINIVFQYRIAKFSREAYRDLATRIFRYVLMMDFRTFKERNSAEITQAITSEGINVAYMLTALLTMAGEMAVVLLIYGLMLAVNWRLTLLLTLFLAMNAVILKLSLTVVTKKAGVDRAEAQKVFYDTVNSSLGNFKFIKLRTDEEKFVERFSAAGRKLSRALTIGETVSHIPRLYLETLGFVTILLMIVYWVWSSGTSVAEKMGLLSLFIIALYRMMPSFNRMITKYNQLIFMAPSVDLVYRQLGHLREEDHEKSIDFSRSIELRNVTFSYDVKRKVLENVSFAIAKGESVALIGESGGGKSTLADMIMGLLSPDSGEILVDGVSLDVDNRRSWRRKFGYIPQEIYLFDGTVAENVAFDTVDRMDTEKVRRVLKQAKILEFLEKEMEGLETKVGEGGVKLSGGQKQRIAIARALYHDPEILVLDEATSALDARTEEEIMNEIYEIASDKTLIIIAHRLSTVERCGKRIRIDHGRIKEIKTQEETQT